MKRIVTFDLLKGLAMYLVVFTHFLQYVTRQTFDNILFQIVYVFHMPLFIILSGYLFCKKLSGPLLQIVSSQFTHLILPSIVLGGVIRLLSVGYIDIEYVVNLPLILWFLSTLFISSVAYAIMYRFTKNLILSTVILSVATLCIPSGLYFLKFTMPFLGIGLILSDMNFIERINFSVNYLLLALVGLICLYLAFWDTKYYVYITPPPFIMSGDIVKWIAYFMRIAFGTVITIYLMVLFKQFYYRGMVTNFIVRCSYNSLYLYIIHFVLLTSIGDMVAINLGSEYLSDVVAFAGALILTIAMNVAIHFLKRNKYTKALVLADFKD